jgi:hypothetical protein
MKNQLLKIYLLLLAIMKQKNYHIHDIDIIEHLKSENLPPPSVALVQHSPNHSQATIPLNKKASEKSQTLRGVRNINGLSISTTARLFHSRQAQSFIAAQYFTAHLVDDMMLCPWPKLLFFNTAPSAAPCVGGYWDLRL